MIWGCFHSVVTPGYSGYLGDGNFAIVMAWCCRSDVDLGLCWWLETLKCASFGRVGD